MERYEEALEAIEAMISGDGLAEDGRLPTERELSERLGIGRRVLRRALGRLEQDGRIVRHQGRGTFVAGVDPAGPQPRGASDGDGKDVFSLLDIANPVELIELRLSLEPVMCRFAALRSSRLEVERLRRQAELTGQADSYLTYQEADSAFHRMIAELSRNSVFIKLQALVSTALRDTALERFGEHGHCFKRQAEHVAFHRAIVDAIAERDTDGAERLMQEHLSDVHRSIFADVIPKGASGLGSEAAEEGPREALARTSSSPRSTPHRIHTASGVSGAIGWFPRIKSAARSAIATIGALMLPLIRLGTTEPSTTRRASMPFTRSWGSTTLWGSSAGPMAQVPTGWCTVIAVLRM